MSDQAANAVMGKDLDNSTGENQSNTEDAQNLANAEANIAAQIVGDGKQYKSVDDLAKSKLEADNRINELKAQLKVAQEAAVEAKTIDDIITRIGTDQSADSYQPGANAQEGGNNLTKADIANMLQEHDKAKQEAEAAAAEVAKIEANQAKAWELLAAEDAFGSEENAKKVVADYIGGDKARANIINQMGGYTPNDMVAFLRANTDTTKVMFSTDEGAVQSKYKQEGVLTWEKVKAMEKENPALKNDRKWHAYVNANCQIL